MSNPVNIEVRPRVVRVDAVSKVVEVDASPRSVFAVPAENIDIENAAVITPSYTHIQNVPSDEWIINHNLGYFPIVMTFTLGGQRIIAQVSHQSINQTRLIFSIPLTGLSRCL